MKIEIWLDKLNKGITHDKATSTYQKGDLFCIRVEGDITFKYPIQNIFCVKEYGGQHSHEEKR